MEKLNDLRTVRQFAEMSGYTYVRIKQMIKDKRIATETANDGKVYIHKDAVISPSKTELQRLKKRQQFEKSLRKKK